MSVSVSVCCYLSACRDRVRVCVVAISCRLRHGTLPWVSVDVRACGGRIDGTMAAKKPGGSELPPDIVRLSKDFYAAQNATLPTDTAKIDTVFKAAVTSTLDGTHLLQKDQAIRLAGLLVQVRYGQHDPTKHKAGFLDDITAVLPKVYATARRVEVEVFEQHRIASDLRLSEPDVKREYVKACFGAVWWGHAWFDVAEDLRKKTKRILCISPDDVSVVDSKTRAKLLSWPMARVQRWAAPKGAITIDFLSPEGGGGENEVASFQTDNSAVVSAALAAFLQIGRQASKKAGPAAAAGSGPAPPQDGAKKKSRWATDAPPANPSAVKRRGSTGGTGGTVAKQATAGNVTAGHLALATAVAKSQKLIVAAEAELSKPLEGPKASTVLQSSTRESCIADCDRHVGGLAAAAATLVVLGGSAQLNRDKMAGVVRAVAASLTALPHSPTRLAALADTPAMAQNTLAATRSLCSAVRAVLTTVSELSAQKGAAEALFSAGAAFGTVASALLRYTHTADGVQGKTLITTTEDQARIKAACQAVAAAGRGTGQSTKDIAGICVNPEPQAKAIAAAKGLAEAIAVLSACVDTTVATVDNPLCLEQVRNAVKLCQGAVAVVVATGTQASTDKTYTSHLKGEAKLTATTLGALDAAAMGVAATCPSPGASKSKGDKGKSNKFKVACRALTASADGLYRAMGQPPTMLKESTQIAKGASAVVALLQAKAKTADKAQSGQGARASDIRRVADVITDTSRKLVAAAKALAESPDNVERQEELLQIGNALGGLGLRSREYS
eukprot:m.83558 g.83558  ORF g.83558 m.83558 type:complete len:785 (-) comp19649_c0_seq2:42-2396(-)